ncbi:peptidoglycan-binding domain-containing protein [Aliikangiella sp. IMCC44359]|uniref:peptidoglycan-binding domain-containing protein n=1 Tax=Aliikangiella sp. IMCC44359 TaxID=3459125 RepID=UPI00403B10CF
MYIKNSVGHGGKNNKNDVFFVQEILKMLATEDFRLLDIKVDGKYGKKTEAAIYEFQSLCVKLKSPDSRIDPNGRSEKTLIAKAVEIDKNELAVLAKKYQLKKSTNPAIESGNRIINYRVHAKKVLSSYSENIIKLAMAYAGIVKCDISSTLRTFDDQARIMYGNCAAYPSATSVSSLRTARGWGYAAAGREIEKLYFANKSKDKDATITIMKEKIKSLYNEGKKVSLHCVAEGDYKNKNVLDIPYSSVLSHKQKDFEIALMGMTQTIKNARYASPIAGETYIDKLIIEDRCWHLEIIQSNKSLPNQKKSTINSRKTKRKLTADNLSLFACFVDDWY